MLSPTWRWIISISLLLVAGALVWPWNTPTEPLAGPYVLYAEREDLKSWLVGIPYRGGLVVKIDSVTDIAHTDTVILARTECRYNRHNPPPASCSEYSVIDVPAQHVMEHLTAAEYARERQRLGVPAAVTLEHLEPLD